MPLLWCQAAFLLEMQMRIQHLPELYVGKFMGYDL